MHLPLLIEGTSCYTLSKLVALRGHFEELLQVSGETPGLVYYKSSI